MAMSMITVTKKEDETFEVTVESATTTRHTVVLKNDYYERLTGGAVKPEILIEKSFEFLMQRESNDLILTRFALPLVSQYFPEFESEIRGSLTA